MDRLVTSSEKALFKHPVYQLIKQGQNKMQKNIKHFLGSEIKVGSGGKKII